VVALSFRNATLRKSWAAIWTQKGRHVPIAAGGFLHLRLTFERFELHHGAGVEAVRRASPESRGVAMGAYTPRTAIRPSTVATMSGVVATGLNVCGLSIAARGGIA